MTGTFGKMEKDHGLTRLIGEIYDAALDSSRWTTVLAKIAEFAGAQAAGLLSKDSVSKSGNVYYQAGVDPYYVRLYSETYWKFDPVADLPDCEIEQIVSVPDLLPMKSFVQDASIANGRSHRAGSMRRMQSLKNRLRAVRF
jgi:hypothetical protein